MAYLTEENVFFKFKDTCSSHKELTNVLLLCVCESNYYYCYCHSNKRTTTCSLCDLCNFLSDESNKIENLSIKKFLQCNYNKREKLDVVLNLITPFFNRIKAEKEDALDFFNKEYYWHSRDIRTGDIRFLSLDQIIESDKELVKNNPHLYKHDHS